MILTEEGGVASLLRAIGAESRVFPGIFDTVATKLMMSSGTEVKLKVPVKALFVQWMGDPSVVEPALMTTLLAPFSEQVPETVMED